jgi:hypothetical protein
MVRMGSPVRASGGRLLRRRDGIAPSRPPRPRQRPRPQPSRGGSGGRRNAGVLAASWLISGYCLRAWRALACLLATVLGGLRQPTGGQLHPRPPPLELRLSLYGRCVTYVVNLPEGHLTEPGRQSASRACSARCCSAWRCWSCGSSQGLTCARVVAAKRRFAATARPSRHHQQDCPRRMRRLKCPYLLLWRTHDLVRGSPCLAWLRDARRFALFVCFTAI